MATVTVEETEFLTIIKFLTKLGHSDETIIEEFFLVYGEDGPSASTILDWINRFTISLGSDPVATEPASSSDNKNEDAAEVSSINTSEDSSSFFTDTSLGGNSTATTDTDLSYLEENIVMTDEKRDLMKQLVVANPKITTNEISKIIRVPRKIVCFALLKEWGFQVTDGIWSQ